MSGASQGSRASLIETTIVVAAFVALAMVGLTNHEMWRDELEIWLIARDSGSLGQLFENMSTQGHPALWYVLTFLIARWTTQPIAMQLLNLVIGASAVALFYARAPFSRLQRLLLCFGYYMLFEFTVISRGYGLALLLIFAFCIRFARTRRIDLVGASLLLLLANTTVYGMIIAANVALLVALQALVDLRERRAALPDGRWFASLAIVLMGVAVGFAHTWIQGRAIGDAHVGVYTPERDWTWIVSCVSTVTRGAVPLPEPGQYHFWNTNILQALPEPFGIYLGAGLALALLALATYGFRRTPVLAVVFALGSATMISVSLFVWYGWVRHHGQIFLWYLVCCWLWYGLEAQQRNGSCAPGRNRWASATLTALLLLQTAAGAHAYAMDLIYPFSSSKATGHYLRRDEFSDATLVGSIDYAIQPVAAYLDRPFYYPESGEFRTFLDWGPSRRHVPVETVLRDALELLDSSGRDVVITFSYQPGSLQPGQTVPLGRDARLRCLARFDGAIVPDEDYIVCRLRRPAPADVDSRNGRNDNYNRDGR